MRSQARAKAKQISLPSSARRWERQGLIRPPASLCPWRTAWVLFNLDKRAGPSATVIKRILSSPRLAPLARRKIEEYVGEKSRGLCGHNSTERGSAQRQQVA